MPKLVNSKFDAILQRVIRSGVKILGSSFLLVVYRLVKKKTFMLKLTRQRNPIEEKKLDAICVTFSP